MQPNPPVRQTPSPLHKPPRRPHAWAWALLLSQALVALAWWHYGWRVGLPLLLVSHLVFVWGTLRPRSALFGPVLTRLPTREQVAWPTIAEGPSAHPAANPRSAERRVWQEWVSTIIN